ncbi:MAG TPA: DNA polymerase IV [Kiritimatiellia bacterium]|nr:DNA polymerase IV [Kiritimatiellia bacterium]
MQSIIHLDMDAFFAAVEVMDHPKWAGKPLIVGSPPDRRGVVSTASYEARKFGIHSAMPSRTAYRLCPHAIFAPPRMSRYLDISEKVMQILHQFTPLVEQVSVDEAFMDVGGGLRQWKNPVELASAIKSRIRIDIGLTASIGLASNKFLAKLASDMKKPDGLTVVPVGQNEILAFLAPLPVSRIWGVGKVTEKVLHEAGIRTIGDLQQMSTNDLAPLVGPALGGHISSLARGLDKRPVITEYMAKSVSAEHTFDDDVSDYATVREKLVELIEQVGRRLRRMEEMAFTVAIKLRFADFQTISRQETLPDAICSDRKLLEAATRLFERQKLSQPVRLIGFGVSGFANQEGGDQQLNLFPDTIMKTEEREGRLDRAVDQLRERIGNHAIMRASSMKGKRSPHIK